MSPFSEALRSLRFQLGLRQQELADLVGCDRTYLSALENDQRPAPTIEFLERLIQALALNEEEAEGLRSARSRSRRTYTVPGDSPQATYDFVHDLFTRLDKLTTRHLRALSAVLQISDPHAGRGRSRASRPSSAIHHDQKEDTM
ncbi:helix-turn-helix transcriptional regulator [Hydrogenophaga sp. BPS33]|uniref:helix-turn-helix transcriptional regulator n=1 Tax=Hydrogenophaga sp. BPS33 TaxID=2651974 RepID=UPI00131FBDDA|nr:helix-turn-helix transcriptional regulator [Hydrogenophaga sp. BPS33]QHE83382.1 helix-turn-helix transcriptional regulator [Hydrogenophaga sp. BPS33]